MTVDRTIVEALLNEIALDSLELTLDELRAYPRGGHASDPLKDLDAKIIEMLDERDALRKIAGPASGNEPVAERDALLAQLQEAEAERDALREVVEAGQVVGSEIAVDLPAKCLICAQHNDDHVEGCPVPTFLAALAALDAKEANDG